ncbi:protein kinase domain-containing protein [Archangium lipolyticum]|uniref:protein kinase domain-containing protein n=1 Tax=Archangium lipolyticum TaxID=2970465 RepID=UPI002DD6A554|nr:protein kinase [Archangium lipolyticum]
MLDGYDSELRMAIVEGLLSKEEAGALREEALRQARSPLELLVERGRLSAETLASLRKEVRLEETARYSDGESPEDDSTLELPSRQRLVEDGVGFPVVQWERYQPVRLLGQGGMGRVFLAHDSQLRRDVALKFVRDDDPEHMRRFLSEARSQARVHHERVCQVYEVGEVQGRAYIAMQYIDGQTLNKIGPRLPLEQKVLVMREVAEGVHAAHRAGLVHRDLKPSNIMVARTGDGALMPYVMDFGLARDCKEGVTATGSVLGTPHYMAPEQARGEVGRLDRRADVYSLGATFYHLLTGVLPIPGSNSLEVLSNIASLEPRPPRSVDPDIPADLEAIVLKCMEKDRSARYDSARALAEDLDRFLNGEPVLARPTGLWYRLRKKARKHRAFVAMAAGALALVLLALAGAGLRLREAERRAALELRSTELVAQIDALAGRPYLLPLHDTSADRERIRTWMRQLDAELLETEDADKGPVHYALGMGHHALGDEAKALSHLESAWQRGYQTPRVAYALAEVMGHLYQVLLLEVERGYQQQRRREEPGDTSAEQRREARKKELVRRYRDPAHAYLEKSEGAPVPPQYVAALLFFLEDRFDDALVRLDMLGERALEFYAAPRLKGDILLARALQHRNHGEPEKARADFEASRQAYGRAADIGRSDPGVHHAMAQLESAVMDTELYGQGNVEPPFERGRQAVARVLQSAPDHYEARVLLARFHRRLAEARATQGKDVEEPVRDALEAAQAARKLVPDRPEAWMELGWSFWRQGRGRQSHNEDPREQLGRAVESLENIAPKDQGYEFHVLRGLIFKTWSDYEAQNGLDSLPRLDKAIGAYREAIQMDESQMLGWLDLVNAYLLRASRSNGRESIEDLEQARVALVKARALNPRHAVLHDYEGRYHEVLASRRRARGEDARPEWEQALARYEAGLALNAGSAFRLNSKGVVLAELGQEAWDRGGEPAPWLERAQAVFEQALRVAPRKFSAYNNLGWLNSRRAGYLLARGEDPAPALRAAERAYQQAIEQAPEHPLPRANLGRALRTWAAFELEQGREPSKLLSRASEALQQALARNPRAGVTLLGLAEVQATQVLWKVRRGQARGEDFEAAAAAFQKTLESEPESRDARLAFGHFLREWALWRKEAGHEPLPILERGLVLADGLSKGRPRWADALLLHASLDLTRVELAAQPEARELERIREELEQALASNHNLAREGQRQLSRLRRLLASSR